MRRIFKEGWMNFWRGNKCCDGKNSSLIGWRKVMLILISFICPPLFIDLTITYLLYVMILISGCLPRRIYEAVFRTFIKICYFFWSFLPNNLVGLISPSITTVENDFVCEIPTLSALNMLSFLWKYEKVLVQMVLLFYVKTIRPSFPLKK